MIDHALPEDGASIHLITTLVGNFSQKDIECVHELWEAYVERGPIATGYDFLVSRGDDGVAGYACYGPTPLTEDTWDLYWLAVHPGGRRKGTGKALLARVEEEVGAQDGRLLLIETSGAPGYEGTRRFYESCGYRYQAVIHDFYAPGDDLLIFGKVLRPVSSIEST
jgi:GNAT superfamily N-acetyltransferase